MKKRNLLGSLMVVSFMAMMSQFAIADHDKDKSLRFESKLSRAQSTADGVVGIIRHAKISAVFDKSFSEVQIKLKIKGGGNVTAAHLHCAYPGEGGPVVVGLFYPGPLMFDGSRAEGTLTNADFVAVDCKPNIGRPVTNIASLALAMREGLIYINVHTSDEPSGEVSGHMMEVDSPDTKDKGDLLLWLSR